MNNNTLTIQKYIVKCDPGFIGYTPEGHYRLNRHDDEGTEHEVVMAPADYHEEHPTSTDEELFAVIHIMLDNIAKTSITPTGDVVDTLLDIKSLFIKYKDEHKNVTGQLLEMFRYNHTKARFYEEKFGEVDIPEDWEPTYPADYWTR
jgi:hypothetical protein